MSHATRQIEREILLTHVQNLVLCLRSTQSFAPRVSRFIPAPAHSAGGAEQTFLAQALRLRALLLADSTVPGTAEEQTTPTALTDLSPSTGFSAALSAASSSSLALREEDVLDVFCQVCTSQETTETATNVALAGLIAIVALPCAFLTLNGLCQISAAATGAKSEMTDRSAHEVLLAKVATLFVACARHPASAALPETWACGLMSFLLAISVDRQASPLLRHVAEKGVYDLVQLVFEHAVAALRPAAAVASVCRPMFRGRLTLDFLSMLVAGDVVAFDSTGDALLPDGRSALESLRDHDSPEASAVPPAVPSPLADGPVTAEVSAVLAEAPSSSSPPSPSPSSSTTRLRAASTPSPRAPRDPLTPKSPLSARGGVVAADVVTLQLEGLRMTQHALTVLGDALHHSDGAGDDDTGSPTACAGAAAELVDAMQHSVSRALLIAGVSTKQVVVLSQILRTVHMTVRCASEYLVPQVLSFLRVLHLNQLTSLAEEIHAAEAGLPVSSLRRAGSPTFSKPPGSPSGITGHSGLLSTAQINDLHERRVVLLESLAEFCADPNLCYYCYVNYDLSWQYAPVLCELCEVLTGNAAAGSEDDTGISSGGPGSRERSTKPTSGAGGSPASGSERPLTAPTPLRAGQAVAVEASARLVCGLSPHTAQGPPPPPPRASVEKDNGHGDDTAADVRAVLTHALAQKQLLQAFAATFDKAPLKEAIPFLLTNSFRAERGHEYEVMREKQSWLVVAEPAGGREIGECLFRLSVVLSKRSLGDYIGDLGRELHESHADDEGEETAAAALARSRPDDPEALIPGTVLFFHHQLLGYMQQFDFRGKSLLRSIREMVFQLSLPGESQKIDRIMESFAHHWFTQNATVETAKASDDTVNPFHTENGAFVLSFAIIMLNTDLHSGKLARNMGVNDFKSINRGIDDGRDIPEAYLARVYEGVRQHEIIMADMIDRGFTNDVTWDLQMRGHSNLHHMPDAPSTVVAALHYAPQLSTAPTWQSTAVPHALNRPILDVIHAPCLRVLGGSLDMCGELLDLETPLHHPTVSATLDALRALHPSEVGAFVHALHGIVALTNIAVQCRQTAAVDATMQVLLPTIDVIPSGRAEENMEDLFLSLCRLLRVRTALGLLPTAGRCLDAAWSPIAALLLRLQYFGLFAWDATEDAAQAEAFFTAHDAVDIPEGLCRNPGWVKTVQERRLAREAKRKRSSTTTTTSAGDQGRAAAAAAALGGNTGTGTSNGGGSGRGGWFASLWNGGADKNEPDALERALVAAEPCVRECVPSIGQLLDLIAQIPCVGRRALSAAMAAACLTTTSTRDPVANLIQHSYILQLLCAIVEPYRTAASFASAPAPATDVNDEEGSDDSECYAHIFSSSRQLIASALEMIQAQRDPAFRSGVESLGRVTAAVMGTVQRRLVLCARRSTVPCSTPPAEHMSGPVWPLVQCLLPPAVPASEYAVLVNPLMVSNLEQTYAAVLGVYKATASASDAAKSGAATGTPLVTTHTASWLRPPTVSPLGLFLPCLTATVLTMAPAAARGAQLHAVCKMLAEVVHGCQYDTTTQTETLVVAAASLALLFQERLAGTAVRHPDTTPAVDMAALSRSTVDLLAQAARHVQQRHRTGSEEDADRCEGHGPTDAAWLMVLKGLCLLLACRDAPRDALEVVLVLQRTVLDTEAHSMPPALLLKVYDEVLLPLVEHVCANGSSLSARPRDTAASPSTSGLAVARAASSPVPVPFQLVCGGTPALSNAYVTRRTMVLNVFSLGAQISTATAVFPSAFTLRLWQTCSASIEVRCRLLNVLPKLLLQEAASLAVTSPDTLRDLWKRVLGTLYAFCDTSSAAKTTESAQLLEGIEETVKNMVFVAASVLRPESLPASFDLDGFWDFTRQLIRPFSFSAPLISLMASLAQNDAAGSGQTEQGGAPPDRASHLSHVATPPDTGLGGADAAAAGAVVEQRDSQDAPRVEGHSPHTYGDDDPAMLV